MVCLSLSAKKRKMDRRRFFKLTGVSLLAVASNNGYSYANDAKLLYDQGNKTTIETNKKKIMKHKCKITVLKRECYKDLQGKYLANPDSGPCPFFHEGQEIMVDGDKFFHMLDGTFCSEAWDCISRYVYAALQGGSIMRGWTNDEKMMITCCNDGTRPVIFKLERIDEEM